ncbi:hypothetical protein F5888DRAFT_1633973 [Russula emetica]|nr:hypothetical protein F5888DRAFT_1633973 [Russula emetica]
MYCTIPLCFGTEPNHPLPDALQLQKVGNPPQVVVRCDAGFPALLVDPMSLSMVMDAAVTRTEASPLLKGTHQEKKPPSAVVEELQGLVVSRLMELDTVDSGANLVGSQDINCANTSRKHSLAVALQFVNATPPPPRRQAGSKQSISKLERGPRRKFNAATLRLLACQAWVDQDDTELSTTVGAASSGQMITFVRVYSRSTVWPGYSGPSSIWPGLHFFYPCAMHAGWQPANCQRRTLLISINDDDDELQNDSDEDKDEMYPQKSSSRLPAMLHDYLLE